jgi:phospholipase/carboxylesterase
MPRANEREPARRSRQAPEEDLALRLEGPKLEPARAGPARQLVVFLHGYGADGNDLLAVGHEWARLMPDAAFAAPHAPEPCGMASFGFQWFPLTFRDPHEYWRGVTAAAPLLDLYLDRALAERGLDESQLALVGFSQGTMMALHVGIRRRRAPAAIVGYSGLLAGPEHVAKEAKSRPPVLLVHGELDDLIPVEALFLAAQGLAAAGIPVEWHVSRGIGHGIDREALSLGGAFLRRAFGQCHGPGFTSMT